MRLRGNMVEIEITDRMKKRAWSKARAMGRLNNSITKGDGNIAGFIGEEVANSIIQGDVQNTYDFDILQATKSGGIKYDVKTKRCTSPPKLYYECSVAAFNIKQKCDRYAFTRVEYKNKRWGRAWILGWIDKADYFSQARKLIKGQIDGENNFKVKADCYNLSIKHLNAF